MKNGLTGFNGLKNVNREKAGTRILDALFPPRCAICDKVVPAGSGHICPDCRKGLKLISEPRCLKCGKGTMSAENEYCYDCSRKERSYVRGYPLYNYEPPISDSLMALKYQGRQEYARFYGQELNRVFGKEFKRIGIDAIVPVPIYKKKLASRGYNQAELIADELSMQSGIRIIKDFIIRTEDTTPQKELSDQERERNMRGAFEPGKKHAKAVLLVDDIYTTGATIENCTKICLEMGVEKVYYTSVAIGKADI